MKLFKSFTHIAFQKLSIYWLEFWTDIIARFVMMYAMYSLWRTLYQQMPDIFDISVENMTSYGILGMLLPATVGVTGFTKWHIARRVREGRLELDLMKPINFVYHMIIQSFGDFTVRFFIVGIVGLLFGYFFLQLIIPDSFFRAVAFVISVILGYVILLCIDLMLGLLSVITLDIRSYNWVMDAVILFASGSLIPLWLFPEAVANILAILPFQAIYFAPLSIYVGTESYAIPTVLLVQLAWAFILLLVVIWFWSYLQHRITIQGG